MKKLILLFTLFLLFQVIDVNAFECRVDKNCGSTEKVMFYLYNNVDTHVSKTNANWPQKLCCSSDMGNSCNPDVLNTPLFKLYLSSDGHVSLTNSNYPEKVCLSVNNVKTGQGNIACTLKYNNQACDQGQKCVLTLSSNDDAHVSACDVAGNYPNKLCCKATPCPKDFVWDPLLNNNKGGCVFQPFECSNLNKERGSSRLCVGIPPYTDSKNLCVVESPAPYERACCLAQTFDGNDYYKYNDIVVKKLVL